jgi:hypothetical protein
MSDVPGGGYNPRTLKLPMAMAIQDARRAWHFDISLEAVK